MSFEMLVSVSFFSCINHIDKQKKFVRTEQNVEVGDVCAYRGELILFDCKSEDAFEDGIEKVKSKPEPDLLYLHQHVNDLAASEREFHEPQHVPVDQGGGHQPLPLYEPDDQRWSRFIARYTLYPNIGDF